MSDYIIAPGTIIDDVEAVVEGIKKVASTELTGIETIKRFISEQNATRFFIDDKAFAKLEPDRGTVYLWLDTGFTDIYGNPIFISLLKNGEEYIGHFFGTAKVLAKTIQDYFPKNRCSILKNVANFRDKYESKINCRAIKHIHNEEQFFLKSFCGDTGESEIFKQISNLHLVFEEEVECLIEGDLDQDAEAEDLSTWSVSEKEISLGLLLDKIDEMQEYIRDLLAKIDELSSTSSDEIDKLKTKNAEYETALKQIREFVVSEEKEAAKRIVKREEKPGHDLLPRNGKVLVLGATEISVNDMRGMVKDYGFEKNDFEFEVDYSKVVSFSGRITNDGKYCAIIFGACPHKASESAGWSSIIEKYKNMENGPIVADAKSNSGKLKVTKDSFRRAIKSIVTELSKK